MKETEVLERHLEMSKSVDETLDKVVNEYYNQLILLVHASSPDAIKRCMKSMMIKYRWASEEAIAELVNKHIPHA